MPRLIEYMSVGICASYGDGDYKVACSASDLSVHDVNEIRKIIPVAIAALERYLQEATEKSSPAGQSLKSIKQIEKGGPANAT